VKPITETRARGRSNASADVNGGEAATSFCFDLSTVVVVVIFFLCRKLMFGSRCTSLTGCGPAEEKIENKDGDFLDFEAEKPSGV
jgi:hypothetical protein